jgi:uncharacterized protein YdeI (YjbR/CyaY-like superfamily)
MLCVVWDHLRMPVARPSPDDVHIFPTADEFRTWLAEHHSSTDALFVGYYKKGVPKQAMTYPQAVEEALCFGWIDGITYRIDDELTATRFTPRRRTSSWSAVNIAKVAELKAAGKMHAAGLRAFEERDRRKDASYSYERPALELEPGMLARFRADARAWAHWQAEQVSYRRTASHWIMSARRRETQERRFGELLDTSRDGRRPKPFVVERAAQ